MGNVIETRNLVKTYRDFWRRPRVRAVKGIDLVVPRGGVFGLLGPNGSGKSTTIKMLLGLLHPTSGEARVLDRKPGDIRVRQRVGYMPEVSLLHPFLTARETLLYYARLFGMGGSMARRRTAELLRMVDLEHAADRPIGGFSKGMARRVALAQALINAPGLLILDEPTSGLDPIGCGEVKDLMRTLSHGGVTILMTSHLLADVEDICDRVAILNHGALTAEGNLNELLSQPDLIRFETRGLSPADASAVRLKLEKLTGEGVRQYVPTMSLESYFIQVVTDKPQRRAFKLAEFLREGLQQSDSQEEQCV